MAFYSKYSKDAGEAFEFLISDFGFELTSTVEKNSGVYQEYKNYGRSIRLSFELIESGFFYSLNQGTKHVMGSI